MKVKALFAIAAASGLLAPAIVAGSTPSGPQGIDSPWVESDKQTQPQALRRAPYRGPSHLTNPPAPAQ